MPGELRTVADNHPRSRGARCGAAPHHHAGAPPSFARGLSVGIELVRSGHLEPNAFLPIATPLRRHRSSPAYEPNTDTDLARARLPDDTIARKSSSLPPLNGFLETRRIWTNPVCQLRVALMTVPFVARRPHTSVRSPDLASQTLRRRHRGAPAGLPGRCWDSGAPGQSRLERTCWS